MRDAALRDHPRDRRRDRRLEHPVRASTRRTARMVVIEMNPRVSRSLGAGVEGDRLPDREDRGQARRRLHARRDPQRHHARDAGLLRADHRLRGREDPALRLREVPGRRQRRSTTQMKSVGEVMAIGRTFKESLRKALRSLEIGRSGLRPASRADRRLDELEAAASRGPTAGAALAARRGACAPGVDSEEAFALDQDRPLVPRRTCASMVDEDEAARCDGRSGLDDRRRRCAQLKRAGLLRSPPDRSWPARPRRRCARRACKHGIRPVYKRVDTCAAEFEAHTPYLYSTYEDDGRSARPTDKKRRS